ncbi:MAG: ABC transporter substrate-binding protein [Clostridia bacterium]|nr:ABC transporter substrate-binding protein [Clostridia bacterium]
MKKLVCFLLAVMLVCPAAGCTKDDGLDEITLVLDWTPNTNHAGLFVAESEGYFEDAGLKVNIIQPPEGGAEALVASNKAQFGISFQDSMAPALSLDKPLDIVAVAAICQHNLSGIISRADKNIYTFSDLEGKSYATWGSPIEQSIIKHCMAQEGADFLQLNMIDSTVTDVLAALETDTVDTVWVYEYWDVIKAEIEGFDFSYMDFISADDMLDYYTPVIITSGKYASENEDAVKRFLTAVKRGYELSAADPLIAAEALLNADETLDRELVTRSLNLLQNYFLDDNGDWGYIDADRWNGFYAWLYENKLVTKNLENVGFNTEYLR